MPALWLPNDRIGLETAQPSIPATFAALGALARAGHRVGWQARPVRLTTPDWPEGHLFQGGFALPDDPAVREILDSHSLAYQGAAEVPAGQEVRPLRLAFYMGRGADPAFAKPLADVLGLAQYDVTEVSDADIRSGRLEGFDVLVVPGSPDAGECYYAGLGDKGYDEIRHHIAQGGHYLGVCGGAYLPLTSYNQERNPYWLDIVEATDTCDLDYWRAGSGFVRCRVDDLDHPVFASVAIGTAPTINVVYWEGPGIEIRGSKVRSLARFESLLASAKDPLKPHWPMGDNTLAEEAVTTWYNALTPELFERLLQGRTAVAEATWGQGHLILFSPHPEMGNFGATQWAKSLNFLLIYNALTYLATL